MQVIGIGKKLEAELIVKGYKTRKDLLKIIDQLPISAQADLKYNPLKKIPRSYIDEIAKTLSKLKQRHIIAGSYRRGNVFSSDIDVVILRHGLGKDPVATLASKLPIVFTYAKGPDKISAIYKHKKYVKIDFFLTTAKEWPCAVTYATGSKQFNIIMRKKAKDMGLLLNQRELKNRKTGIPIKVNSEKHLFKLLKITWKNPEKRNL